VLDCKSSSMPSIPRLALDHGTGHAWCQLHMHALNILQPLAPYFTRCAFCTQQVCAAWHHLVAGLLPHRRRRVQRQVCHAAHVGAGAPGLDGRPAQAGARSAHGATTVWFLAAAQPGREPLIGLENTVAAAAQALLALICPQLLTSSTIVVRKPSACSWSQRMLAGAGGRW
jgi:hypothetical protein